MRLCLMLPIALTASLACHAAKPVMSLAKDLSLFFSKIEWRGATKEYAFLTQTDLRDATCAKRLTEVQKDLSPSKWMCLREGDEMVLFEPVCRLEIKCEENSIGALSLRIDVATDLSPSVGGIQIDTYRVSYHTNRVFDLSNQSLGPWSWPFQALWTNGVGRIEYEKIDSLVKAAEIARKTATLAYVVVTGSVGWVDRKDGVPRRVSIDKRPFGKEAMVVSDWSGNGVSNQHVLVCFQYAGEDASVVYDSKGKVCCCRYRSLRGWWQDYGCYDGEGRPLKWLCTVNGLLMPDEPMLERGDNGEFVLSMDAELMKACVNQIELRMKAGLKEAKDSAK